MLIQDIKPPMIKTKVPVRIAGSVKVIETIYTSTSTGTLPLSVTTSSAQHDTKAIKVELVFNINGKQYRGTPYNCEVMDAYMHTGDSKYLSQLEGGK